MFRRLTAYSILLVGLTLGVGLTRAEAPAASSAGLADLLGGMSARRPQAGRDDRAQAANRLAGKTVPGNVAEALQTARRRWFAQAEAIVTRLAEKQADDVRTCSKLQALRHRAIVDIVLRQADLADWQTTVKSHAAAIRKHLCIQLDRRMDTKGDLGRIVTLLKELDGYARMLGLRATGAAGPADRLRDVYCHTALLGDVERRVLQHNRDVAGELSAEERQCVALLNNYRMLLGLHPLRIDLRLVRACRKYARECAAQNHYSHAGSLPGRETRDQRAAQEGYPAHVAENLAFGARIASGAQAFGAWFRSMPHHRVIINRRHALRARGDDDAWKYPRYYAVGVGHTTGGRYQNNWCLLLGTGARLDADELAQAETDEQPNRTDEQ